MKRAILFMNKNFEEMIGKLSPILRRITHKLNGHFTFFDDDDLFQEALEHLWIAYKDGNLSDKTDSYVLQGCYFHLKNYIRKAMDRAKLTSLNSVIGEEGSTIEDLLMVEDHSIVDAVDSAMLAERIHMSGLSKKEEEVLRLSLEEMTVREIGRKMGISHVMVIKLKKRVKIKCEGLKKEIQYGRGHSNAPVRRVFRIKFTS